MAAAPETAKPRSPMIWVQGLLCGGLVAWMPAIATLTAILLAPGLIAYFVDRSPTRAVGRSVLLFGAVLAPQSLLTLWHAGNSMAASLGMAADMRRVSAIWSLQAGGWLLAELTPVLVRLVLDGKAFARRTQLQRRRAQLEEEWTLPPRGDGADQPMAPP